MHEQKQTQETPGPAWQRSIITRLRWSYLISSTLPLLLVGTILIVLNFRTQQQSVYNEQVLLAMQAVRNINSYTSSIESQLLGFGQDMNADTPREQWIATAQELINTNYPNLREIAVFDTDGTEIMHLSLEHDLNDGSDQVTSTMSTDLPHNLSLIDLALRGLGQRGDIYRTDDERLVFPIVLPLRNRERKAIGAVQAIVNAIPIEQSLRVIGRGSNSVAYLVSEQEEVMISGSTEAWNPPANLSDVLNRDEEYIQYEREGVRVLIYQGANDTSALGVIAPINPTTWSVVVEQPLQVAFSNVWTNMIVLGTLVAGVGVLALGWGLLMSQRFSRSIRALRQGAFALGEGHLDHRIEVGGKDEMQQLAVTFNQMAEQLQVSLSEIESQNKRMREGLLLARDIQIGLLPTHAPWNQETPLTVYARSIPAFEVGGDFYSYIALHGGKAAISVGDISGKGVGAALMMALTTSMIETQARHYQQPSEVLAGLNQLLRPRLRTNHMNAALIYAVFDPNNQTMTVANAGMIAPLLVRRKGYNGKEQDHMFISSNNYSRHTCQFIDVGGMPIGSMPNALYRHVVTPIEPGDIVLFMSDGVVEAHNREGEMFGFERLDQLFASVSKPDNIQNLVDTIVQRVQEFIGEAEQHDDITIVAVRPAIRIDSGTWYVSDTTGRQSRARGT